LAHRSRRLARCADLTAEPAAGPRVETCRQLLTAQLEYDGLWIAAIGIGGERDQRAASVEVELTWTGRPRTYDFVLDRLSSSSEFARLRVNSYRNVSGADADLVRT
jgi:hypothetical protein